MAAKNPGLDPDAIIDTMLALDPLTDLPRTGWLLRGVRQPESIAAHSHGVAMVAMWLVDALRAEGADVDGERVLRMALVHDAAEVRTGDIPMPAKDEGLRAAIAAIERQTALDVLPTGALAAWTEAHAKQSLEARIVAAADKLQMMIKVHAYERQGAAALAEFWTNPGNFRHMELPAARRVYEALCRRAGKPWPA